MKIYHRKNFLIGLGETLLGLLNLLLAFLNGFELSNLVIGLACLFFGVGTILRACSRKYAIEDKLDELDELSGDGQALGRDELHRHGGGDCAGLPRLAVCGDGNLSVLREQRIIL